MMDFHAFTDEFCKLAAQPISREDAEKSLKRLQTMQENRDLGALARSAAVGAAVMPFAGVATRATSGAQKFLKPGAKVTKNPVSWAKALNWKDMGRRAVADSMFGTISGGVTPLAREAVEHGAQRAKLRDYIEQEEGVKRHGLSKFRSQVEQHTGI